MEWDPDEARSDDIIDKRGAAGSRGGLGGLGGLGGVLGGMLGGASGGRSSGGRSSAKKGGGIGAVLLLAVVAFLGKGLLGGGGFDLSSMGGLEGFPSLDAATGSELNGSGDPSDLALDADSDPDREIVEFSNVVLTDANDTWEELFDAAGETYERTKLVLFSGNVTSACGAASSAMGPFYCPGDNLVYIDLSFFEDLATTYDAEGDFAQAYVLAHEVGHHVQNELGTSAEVRRLEAANPDDADGPNGLSVRQELQADCYAGVWAHARYQAGKLESGDLGEALSAAEGVGDDRLQRQATGQVNPDLFSHGTSEQRQKWFEAGYESGDPGSCDTFSESEV